MSSQSRPRHLSCDSLSPAAEMSLFMLVFSELFPYRHEEKVWFLSQLGDIRFSTPKHTHSANSCLPRERFRPDIQSCQVRDAQNILGTPRASFEHAGRIAQNRLFCSGSLSGSYSSCCWVWGGVPSAATVSCATSIAAGAEEILVLAGTHPFSRKSEQVAERFAILSLACSAGKNGARWLSILLSTMR